MKTILYSLVAGFSLLGAFALHATAQPPARGTGTVEPVRLAPPAPSQGKKRVAVVADKTRYIQQTGVQELRGDVSFRSEDTMLTTDFATYNEKTQIATSPGPLKLVDLLNTVTGNTGTAFYRTKDAKLRGNVVIVARPRESDRNAPEGSARRRFDAPATISCESVDYNWGNRIAVLTGGLKVVQKDRIVTADKAVYEARLEKVTMEGNVYFTNAKGEKFRAVKVIIYMKEGEESFEGEKVQGEFEVEDEFGDSGGANGAKPGAVPNTTPNNIPNTIPNSTPKPDPTKPGTPETPGTPSVPKPGGDPSKPAEEPTPANDPAPKPEEPKERP